ncbi:AAA family ATPase [Actinomadura sp. 9N407]|uniref:AAA family ATPase n=1 Tax=Actinomadura sp. 9N407 TaxID=3375154 RepID=UPI003789E66C
MIETSAFPAVPAGRPGPELLGRRAEREALGRSLAAVRTGESRSLVLWGEAGVGKSALLEHLIDAATGCRVVRAAGVPSEAKFPFAALHQLCVPMLDLLDRLPEPKRNALGAVFGRGGGTAPDPFLLGLGVLGLLAEAARDRPLVCVIDDAQWLDRASKQTLAFAARRLSAEPVMCVFAVRGDAEPHDLAALPMLRIAGLPDDDARALLDAALAGPLDEQVRDQIVAEARGNPPALLALPRELPYAELAGGFGAATARTLTGRIDDGLRRRLERLPSGTRQLLLLASAEPLGDPALLWRAASLLGDGIGAGAVTAADDDLIEVGDRVRFRHPLLRPAVYRAASPGERRRAHRALAEATDADTDPDRRAWHRAHGTMQPDEEVAAELERSAGRAQARGGLAAAAAFLQRATALTPDSRHRAERALAAAQAEHLAGASKSALDLLASARGGPPDELRLAKVEILRAQIAAASDRGSSAPSVLLDTARRLEPLDTRLARDTYLQALAMAISSAPGGGGCVEEVAAATRAAPPAPGAPRPTDLLLDALALFCTEDARTAAPAMRRALTAFIEGDIPTAEQLRWLPTAHIVAVALWDDGASRELADRHLRLARENGAVALLPLALSIRATGLFFEGRLEEAAALNEELQAIADPSDARTDHGVIVRASGSLALAAWRGQRDEFERVGDTSAISHRLKALMYNGLGQYAEAAAAAKRAGVSRHSAGFPAHWASAELVEAAVRGGDPGLAAEALERVVQTTRASGTCWALGIEARSRALLCEGEEADRLHREAIERLARTRMRVDLARAHLVYGEWLRRERRRTEAREQLSTAAEMFTAMGMKGFTDRAARELPATEATARKRTADTIEKLTPQEEQIARLARGGLTNKAIAGRLYVSHRTVEYHLHKVFTKLNITSRHQLEHISWPSDALAPVAPGQAPQTLRRSA